MFGFGKKKYDVGIVLGGGGARGFANLGVLQALKEEGIVPDVISSVSAGSIVGAFTAAGKTPIESFEIMKDYRFFDFSRIRFPRSGLFNLDGIRKSLEKEIPFENIEELPIPLIIASSNMLEGKVEYFSQGPIAQIVQASSSIPIIFSPVEIDGKLYADGGIFDNLPLDPIYDICKKTIVVNISPVQAIDGLKNLVQAASRMFQLSVNSGRLNKRNRSSLFIEPVELRQYDILDTKHASEIYQIGYDYVKNIDINL
ncbi:MAG: patatin-like phospholipase family protein [Bacteroidota bacterium]